MSVYIHWVYSARCTVLEGHFFVRFAEDGVLSVRPDMQYLHVYDASMQVTQRDREPRYCSRG